MTSTPATTEPGPAPVAELPTQVDARYCARQAAAALLEAGRMAKIGGASQAALAGVAVADSWRDLAAVMAANPKIAPDSDDDRQ